MSTDIYARAVQLYRNGKAAQAEQLCRRILRSAPRHVAALSLLGHAQLHQGKHEDAIASLQAALRVNAQLPEVHRTLGTLMVQRRRMDEALAHYDAALALRPDWPELLLMRGNALHRLNRHAEAVESYDRALSVEPHYVDALNNRGLALARMWRFEEAVASYDRLLAVSPEQPDTLFNRGNALRRLGRLVEALGDYRKAYALRPDHPQVLGTMVRCELLLCDWDGVERDAPELHRRVLDGTALVAPFSWLSLFDDPAGHLVCARQAMADHPGLPRPTAPSPARTRERIRLAYVSPNFRDHNMSTQIAGLFALHDRTRFEVVAISFGPDDGSGMRKRLMESFDEFHDVRARSDRAIAALMRERGIDIAIDLNGHLDNARPDIFAARAAPIQVNYLGYPGTIGADFIDYVIGDAIVTPFSQADCYSERIVQLPGSYIVNDRRKPIAANMPTREACGLPPEGFVFCCFNLAPKIRAPLFDVWMRLLASIEGSVLWLSQTGEAAAANLRRQAALRGVAPERLVFAKRLERLEDHLARLRVADLFLDTLPFNAHTTACDALWAGLPMLTCPGKGFAARVGASALHAVGLPELVVPTLADYAALARRLASEPALLASLRQRLEAAREHSPLFDTDAFRRNIESAYRIMWETWQRGEPPRSFAVERSEDRRADAHGSVD